MVLYGVIMAGGYGTRFWPYSRSNRPKQLLTIFSDKSMMQETVDRLQPLIPNENIFISTNEKLARQIKKEIPQVNYIVEPMQKDTAACIGLSALTIFEKDPEGIMFIETSDHVCNTPDSYLDTVRRAVIAATKGKIVLLGINPTFPHTGLGYIHFGNVLDEGIPDSFIVREFKEKPDFKTATAFVESKKYLWNSGMFIAKCSVILEEMRMHMPQLYECLMKIKENKFDAKAMAEAFERLEKISIDYGVIEKSKNVAVIRSTMDWDDIGDFTSLERRFPKDEKKNVALCEHEGNSAGCILLSKTRKVIANDVKDIVVADTPDATLICQKSDMKNIKKIIEKIKNADLGQYLDDYVQNYNKHIISHESDDCDVETDGLIVLLGVSNLSIKRDSKTLTIEGIEEEVEIDAS